MNMLALIGKTKATQTSVDVDEAAVLNVHLGERVDRRTLLVNLGNKGWIGLRTVGLLRLVRGGICGELGDRLALLLDLIDDTGVHHFVELLLGVPCVPVVLLLDVLLVTLQLGHELCSPQARWFSQQRGVLADPPVMVPCEVGESASSDEEIGGARTGTCVLLDLLLRVALVVSRERLDGRLLVLELIDQRLARRLCGCVDVDPLLNYGRGAVVGFGRLEGIALRRLDLSEDGRACPKACITPKFYGWARKSQTKVWRRLTRTDVHVVARPGLEHGRRGIACLLCWLQLKVPHTDCTQHTCGARVCSIFHHRRAAIHAGPLLERGLRGGKALGVHCE